MEQFWMQQDILIYALCIMCCVITVGIAIYGLQRMGFFQALWQLFEYSVHVEILDFSLFCGKMGVMTHIASSCFMVVWWLPYYNTSGFMCHSFFVLHLYCKSIIIKHITEKRKFRFVLQYKPIDFI